MKSGKIIGHEGSDRANIDLPGHQLDLLKDVANSATGEINFVVAAEC